MSGKVVQFGGNAAFFKRRAASLKQDRPSDAMKFLYRALGETPGDGDALVDAAALALSADRPRLAVRLAAQAIASPNACYILGCALSRMGFDAPALTALAACAHETQSDELRDAATRAIYALRQRETGLSRREARVRRMKSAMRAHLLDDRPESAARIGWEGVEKYPDDGFEPPLVDALWRRGRISMASHMGRLSQCPVPLKSRLHDGGVRMPDVSLVGMREAMLRGEYEKVVKYPPLPGAERSYMRVAAAARLGLDRAEYLPLLLDMQAMDPEDPAVEWALQLIHQGRDRELPPLYGVCREAKADLTARLTAGREDKTAVRWGLRRKDACMMAAAIAVEMPQGAWLLRDALADPFVPSRCRAVASAALLAMGEKPPFVGITPQKLWIGDAREPQTIRLPGAGLKVLRMAMDVSSPEMAPALFQAWGAFVECGAVRRAARDLDGWAAAVALAGQRLDGEHRDVQITITRRVKARTRALLKRTTKENIQ